MNTTKICRPVQYSVRIFQIYSLSLLLLLSFSVITRAQFLPGFKLSDAFEEQQMLLEDAPANTRILINAPLSGFDKNNRVLLIFYALPNGNTIENTFGKSVRKGTDWHYNIQHIGAQTRFLRTILDKQTIVVVYLESKEKSWPLWKKNNPNFLNDTKAIVEDITSLFKDWNPQLVLNGHSGGGRFIFSYIEAVGNIPDNVKRIAFIDSNYGYEDSIHGEPLTVWLKSGKDKYLSVMAYNDSIVEYNNKPLVSPTGGTWYRSKMMKNYLSDVFRFRKEERETQLWYTTQDKQIEIILETNPEKKILHTTQVEQNGFIHSILSGTKYEEKNYNYLGEKAYSAFIPQRIDLPIRRLNIPAKKPNAEKGSEFMKRIDNLSIAEREEEIYKALSEGNMPLFLRNTISLEADFADAEGNIHKIQYEAMPDYLSVGNEKDFCRIPMSPHTAQRLALDFGASLLTSKLSDHIYRNATIKLSPFPYEPVGNANELVSKFIDHNTQIELQKKEVGGKNGQLIAGIKKDVILSERIASQPDKVVIYGWHKPDGHPIQPVYSGHVAWYVDYSHGIRFINNQVILDGQPVLLSDILTDPLLYKLFSDEEKPMTQPYYQNNLIKLNVK